MGATITNLNASRLGGIEKLRISLILARQAESVKFQMAKSASEVITVQYSTVNKNKSINNSTVQYSNPDTLELFRNLSDVIPDDGFYPFYQRRLKSLGYKRFVEFAGKARAGSDTPAKLFCWMLKNPELVR